MPEPTTTAKKPVSDKQLAANRLNAQASTGPRTAAGKLASRFGNLKLGLFAEVPILPGEDGAAYRKRLEDWSRSLNPTDEAQRYQLERAVLASWKLDRAESIEVGMIDKHMDDVAEAADDDELADTERFVAALSESPALAVHALRKSPGGCLWLLTRWGLLAERLIGMFGLLSTEFFVAMNLLGRRVSDVFSDDPLVVRWAVAQLSAVYGDGGFDMEEFGNSLGGKPAGMTRDEYAIRLQHLADVLTTVDEGRAALEAYIAEVRAELTAHLAVIEELTEFKRARQVSNARMVLTPAGKQLAQQQKRFEGSIDAALRRLKALQNPGKPRPGPKAKTQEMVAATTSEMPAPITTETEFAVSDRAECPDGDTTGGPVAGTSAAAPESPAEVVENGTEAICDPTASPEIVENRTEPICDPTASPEIVENRTEAICDPQASPEIVENRTEAICDPQATLEIVENRTGPICDPPASPEIVENGTEAICDPTLSNISPGVIDVLLARGGGWAELGRELQRFYSVHPVRQLVRAPPDAGA